ncbi:MAG: hypothetical protein IJ629_00790 [Clostridia bacterium]|nr:hypothetical protein [Clostridia bacterium]
MEYFDPAIIMPKKMLQDEFFQSIKRDLTNRIPKDIGEMLIRENNDPEHILIYHRTSRVPAKTIFQNGLLIAGGNNIEYTTSRDPNNIGLFVNINGAAGYKSDGGYGSRVILMRIPKSAIEYEPGISKPILMKTDDVAEQGGGMAIVAGKTQTYLLPEYIIGSLEYEDGKIAGYIENPNYREVHDYQNNGLTCTEELIYSFIEQKRSDLQGLDFDTQIEVADQLIIDENNEYMLHPEKFPKVSPKVTRSEEEIKEFSLKDIVLSKLKKSFEKIKRIFDLDKEKDER